ncbi:MAG: hypothetical protein Q9172_007777, partial [Xanthocarpia lactea]
MSRIQELPDGPAIPNTLPSSPETPFPISTKSTVPNASSTTPALPPAMDSVRSHTADEIIQMMKRTPLFMTDLGEVAGVEGEDNEENIELEALRALQYEGTRAEVALGFKERGNEMVADKRWKDAKEFYTKGILALKKTSEQQEGQSISSNTGEEPAQEKEKEKERKIEEACYVNRALCNLELKLRPHPENYRSTLTDTAHALTLSPTNAKAHYRSSLALLALSKHDLALDTCNRGLALTSPTLASATNTTVRPSAEYLAFRTLHTRILHAQADSAAKESLRLAAETKKRNEQQALKAALTARGIKIRMTANPPDMEDAVIHLEPVIPSSSSSSPPKSTTTTTTTISTEHPQQQQLHFPLLLLYPTHSQSDLIKSVAETDTFSSLLQTVLSDPLPWDTAREYTLPNPSLKNQSEQNINHEKNNKDKDVDLFMETPTGGMIKVGRRLRLLDVLGGGKVEVVDGVVR